MATLTIRNLPDEVRDALRVQAAVRGRSMEAEVREVLKAAVVKPDTTKRTEAIRRLKEIGAAVKKGKPEGWSGVDELIAERRLEAAHEAGRVSAGERLDYLARLQRFEILPEDVEAFALSRLDSEA